MMAYGTAEEASIFFQSWGVGTPRDLEGFPVGATQRQDAFFNTAMQAMGPLTKGLSTFTKLDEVGNAAGKLPSPSTKADSFVAKRTPAPQLPTPTVDPLTGQPVGRFIGNQNGPPMIEPVGGRTVPAGLGGVDTHTLYPNGANYQRLNPVGHPNNPTPHGHGHAPGTGPAMQGQGPSLDRSGNVVPWNSTDAHWPYP